MSRIHPTLVLAALLGCTTATPPTGEPRDGASSPSASAAHTQALVDAVARWQASCSTPVLDGLCLHPRSEPAGVGCRPTFVGRHELVARDPDAAAIQTELAELLHAAATETAESPEQDDALRAAIAAAELARVDAELEQFAALRFDQPDLETQRRVVTDKLGRGSALITRLAAIKDHDDVPSNLRAAMRTAWVNLLLADELTASPVPANVERADFCAALLEYDPELVDRARDAVRYCVLRADEQGIASPMVDTCRELSARIDPASSEDAP